MRFRLGCGKDQSDHRFRDSETVLVGLLFIHIDSLCIEGNQLGFELLHVMEGASARTDSEIWKVVGVARTYNVTVENYLYMIHRILPVRFLRNLQIAHIPFLAETHVRVWSE